MIDFFPPSSRSFNCIVSLLFIAIFSNSSVAQPVLSLTPVITGLSSPIQMVNAGDRTDRVFIVQKGGTIVVYDKSYNSLGTFLTVTGLATSGERGLLSMVFHPGYSTNGFFY